MNDEWWRNRLLEDGRLDDNDTKSEYERGYIDCWNENQVGKNISQIFRERFIV